LYLARKRIGAKNQFYIRESYRAGDTYLSRDLFDLGDDPGHYIVYPGGNSFYIDETVEDRLNQIGAHPTDSEMEDIFWPFLMPEIRRALETFRRREKRSLADRKFEENDADSIPYHIFDKRRIYFLKFGRTDLRGIGRLPAKLFKILYQKSRDEIEQNFIEMETMLSPREYKKYNYVIFDLQQYFNQSFAIDTPELLEPEDVDRYFIDGICRLNADTAFWAGMDVGMSLHSYLIRYLIMYFDFEFAPRSFMEEYINNFMNSRRDHRPPQKTEQVSMQEAGTVFGKSKETLRKMSRKDLARRYRKLALKLHPDQGGDHDKFVKLTRAYHSLLRTKP